MYDSKMKKVFAFVFARGGSKGLSRKNLRSIGGKPLVAHSILMAKQIKQIDRVFVSTEDDEIKNVANHFGAEIIDRPASLASDEAPEFSAWKHAVNYLEQLDESFDIFLSLPPTSPLRSRLDVISCINALDDEADAVITVTAALRSPQFNMVSRGSNGICEILLPSRGYVRRQDVPQSYDITTVAYAVKREFVITQDNIFDGCVKSVVVPKDRAVDIDDEIDFRLTKLLYEIKCDDASG